MTVVNAVGNSLTGLTGTGTFVGATSPTISRPLINNTISGYSTTATAAGTTTLTVSSNYQQFFTGVTTQTVVMPVTSTLTVGQSWLFVNNSSGIVTVQSSGANSILAMAGGTNYIITCIAQAGTTAADWNAEGTSGVAGVDSITGTANQVIASASVGPVTLSLPQSIATTSDVTFGSVAFSPTTKGVVGTATNDNAAAGYVGEFISSTITSASATAFPGSTGTAQNLTSISLTAGDWDVWGQVGGEITGGFLTALDGGISTTSATLPALELRTQMPFPAATLTLSISPVPYQRLSLSGTTTVYMIIREYFSAGTATMFGGIYARRAR